MGMTISRVKEAERSSPVVTTLARSSIGGGSSGVYGADAADTVVNTGVITGTTGAAIALVTGGSVSNRTGGTIAGLTQGVYIRAGAGTVVNAALIAASGPAASFQADW